MLNWQRSKNKIFLQVIALIIAQIFFITTLAYAVPPEKIGSAATCPKNRVYPDNKLRPILSFSNKEFKNAMNLLIAKNRPPNIQSIDTSRPPKVLDVVIDYFYESRRPFLLQHYLSYSVLTLPSIY